MDSGIEPQGLVILGIESERFGIRVARAPQVSDSNLPGILESCSARGIDLLIARCSTTDLGLVQNMEREGFFLTDTLVYYGYDLAKHAIPDDTSGILVRPCRAEDEDRVQSVAAGAFRHYLGHYHADPRLDRGKCDQAYISWAKRSCTIKEVAEQVFVAERHGEIAGFGTLRLNSPQEGEGLLFAISPESQGLGICRSLMIRSLQWCRSEGAQRMIISTQVTNVSMQKVWCRTGFEPRHSFYTFHKWFTQR